MIFLDVLHYFSDIHPMKLGLGDLQFHQHTYMLAPISPAYIHGSKLFNSKLETNMKRDISGRSQVKRNTTSTSFPRAFVKLGSRSLPSCRRNVFYA
jgi:hypothetical protein